jgi:phosphotransferase system HPr (HPr) family protein
MVSQTVVFQCDEALQMKAVAVLIQKASSFRSSIYLSRSGRRANAKSLLGVMSLGIENAAEIEVTADGEDQQDALKALVSYLENPSAL